MGARKTSPSAIKAATYGLTLDMISGCVNKPAQTLRIWERDNPELFDIVCRGTKNKLKIRGELDINAPLKKSKPKPRPRTK